MNLEQFTQDEGQVARRYDYDDETVLAVDFGPTDDASVDVVDDTVIVVVSAEPRSADRSGGDKPHEGGDQFELELPHGASDVHTFMKNGVLTVEMEGDL